MDIWSSLLLTKGRISVSQVEDHCGVLISTESWSKLESKCQGIHFFLSNVHLMNYSKRKCPEFQLKMHL